jgi:hypothetical protein
MTVVEFNAMLSNSELNNPDELLIKDSHISIQIDYPMQTAYVFSIYNKNGHTRRQIFDEIKKSYQLIYSAEKKTTTQPIMSVGEMNQKRKQEFLENGHTEDEWKEKFPNAYMSLTNRCATDGVFKIYGHALGDLYLHSMMKPRSDDGCWHLNIDS